MQIIKTFYHINIELVLKLYINYITMIDYKTSEV